MLSERERYLPLQIFLGYGPSLDGHGLLKPYQHFLDRFYSNVQVDSVQGAVPPAPPVLHSNKYLRQFF